MIGYYVHHQGRGHLHRALAVQQALDEPVTVLSSLAPPTGHPGDWVHLDRDDLGIEPREPTAGGRLHWVPVGDDGLAARMQQLSAWLATARPRLLVSDVSVEVALLARLHGVPVVGVVLPGRRDDAAHLLGFDVADRLVAMWPPTATPAMLPGLPARVVRRVERWVRCRGSRCASRPVPAGVGRGRRGWWCSAAPVARRSPRRRSRPRCVPRPGGSGRSADRPARGSRTRTRWYATPTW
ncbi:hypothetical protein [Nocardioides sp. dk884]|uniref:hypothetical protein n=1 Tax=Nocardioides sp. dk884 TaxID=2662361 RepID=UPI0012956677|nr:hypothetical protein [Nocardioides sp. dk884]QGA07532.1 hypothetical protein GFH29_09130 [Nocardioides sp. dk884]